jgi:hypothetical protein
MLRQPIPPAALHDHGSMRSTPPDDRSAHSSTYDAEAMRAHGFTDIDIFDIVAIAAARSFFTKMLDGLGAHPDADYLQMDEMLRRVLTVGRPIAEGELERLTAAASVT